MSVCVTTKFANAQCIMQENNTCSGWHINLLLYDFSSCVLAVAQSKEGLVLRDFNFAVIDEVDSILIDEARTPLIISGIAGIGFKCLSIKPPLLKTIW